MSQSLIYAGYERKSTEDSEDKQIASIESQRRELTEVATRLGLKVKYYSSESKSAHKVGRPAFNKILEDIENGVINALLVYHANRLSRNSYDTGRLIYLMDEGKLVEIRTPGKIYRNSPDDKFMLSLEFGMSKKDSDDKGIVVKRGLKNKLINGWRPGIAPQGYLNDKTQDIGARTIKIDPDRFSFIQKIFELKLNGTPVNKIHRIAKDEWGYRTRKTKRAGGKPLSKSMIYNILTNPFYAGKYEYPLKSGNWYEGKHQKAIRWEVFEKIQITLGAKGFKTKPHTKEFSYTGLIQCGECHGLVTAEEKHQVICSTPNCKYKFALTQKNKGICPKCKTSIENMTNPKFLHYVYYHCTKSKDPHCSQKYIELKELERQIAEKVGSIEINDIFMEWAIDEINRENTQDQDFENNRLQSLQKTHSDCQQKLANLLALKISPSNTDGHILSDERFNEENKKLEEELESLTKQLDNFNKQIIQRSKEVVDKFNFASHAKERFDIGDIATKRQILTDLGSNFTLMDKILSIELPEIFIRIQNMKQSEPLTGKLIEPKDQSLTTTQLINIYSNNPAVLRD